jgi:spermidine/putrescine transport system ATP-binding protein
VRPEMIELASTEKKLPKEIRASFTATVLNRIFVGDFTQYRLVNDALGEFLVVSPRRSERDVGIFDIGDSVAAGWRGDAAQVLADT